MTPQHFHANIYQKIIPEGFYDYSFCIVRNPFDRLVSEYAMRDTDDYSFDDWVKFIFPNTTGTRLSMTTTFDLK